MKNGEGKKPYSVDSVGGYHYVTSGNHTQIAMCWTKGSAQRIVNALNASTSNHQATKG